jgi:hypothetical protein
MAGTQYKHQSIETSGVFLLPLRRNRTQCPQKKTQGVKPNFEGLHYRPQSDVEIQAHDRVKTVMIF